MNNRKLIALDLDGTLLDNKKNISNKTKNYLKQLENEGHIICLTSGRPPRSIKSHYNEIGLHGPFIGYNGDYVFNSKNNSITIFKIMPKKFFIDLFNEFKSFDYFVAEDIENLYLESDKTIFDDFLNPYDINIEIGKVPDIFKGDICSCFFRCMDAKKRKDILNFVSNYKEIEMRYWYDLPEFGEFFPSSVSKRTGLELIQKEFKIKDEDIIAFGDGENDYEMLSFAHDSFAMKNGSDELKKHAKKETTYDNDHDGVYFELKKILG